MSDDNDWLDALAGRDTAHSAARREARALRDALLAAKAAPDNLVSLAPPDARRERQLLERAGREGVIPRMLPHRNMLLAIAAGVSLMVTAGLLIRQQPPQRGFEVVRGSEAGIVQLEADHPAELKKAILDSLRAAGVEATGYEALGVHGIDADLPRPLTPAVRNVLGAFDIPEPADGVLRIEIRGRE